MSYIDIDEYGISEIRCMKCNKPVAARTYVSVPDKKDKNKKVLVMALRRLPEWNQKRRTITLEGEEAGIDAIYCSKCVQHPHHDKKELKKKVIMGWQAEHKFQNKDELEIEKFERKFKKDMKEVGIMAKHYTDAKEEKDKKGR